MTTASGRPVRLVLHPGHPKCGSSSIQDALWQNADALADRGIFYPSRRPNRIFIEACDAQDFDPVEEWLVRLLGRVREASCDTLVVSSENLGVRQLVSGGRGLHEVFRRHCQPVDVVYYLRRQDDWMVSMWQQWGHKAGHSLRRFVDDRLGFDEPGYLPAVEMFEDVYGADRVVAVPLHGDALVGGDLISDFRERTGVGPLAVEDPGRHRNPSMSGFLCSVLARVPDVYDQTLVERVAEGRTDHSVGRLLEQHVSRELLFNRDKRVLPLAERRRILDHFEDDNRALHARYFPDVPFDTVFGVQESRAEEPVEQLQEQVDGLEDVVAMQMQVIVSLLRERQQRGLWAHVRRLVARATSWLNKIRSMFRR